MKRTWKGIPHFGSAAAEGCSRDDDARLCHYLPSQAWSRGSKACLTPHTTSGNQSISRSAAAFYWIRPPRSVLSIQTGLSWGYSLSYLFAPEDNPERPRMKPSALRARVNDLYFFLNAEMLILIENVLLAIQLLGNSVPQKVKNIR